LPNFDLWYPLGISATVYSILTIRLALRRVARRLRKMLGLESEEIQIEKETEKIELVYPVIVEALSELNSRNSKNPRSQRT